MKYKYEVIQDCYTDLTGEGLDYRHHLKGAIIVRRTPMDRGTEEHLLMPVSPEAIEAYGGSVSTNLFDLDTADLGILYEHLRAGTYDVLLVKDYLRQKGDRYQGDDLLKLCKHIEQIRKRENAEKGMKAAELANPGTNEDHGSGKKGNKKDSISEV